MGSLPLPLQYRELTTITHLGEAYFRVTLYTSNPGTYHTLIASKF
jgi:hypothetical protein